MFRRMKSTFFDDMPKPTLRLSTSFLSQTRNILLPYPFFCRLPTNRHLSKTYPTPAPGKILFLELRSEKRDVGQKNNSKQLLFSCYYTNFCSFAHKSQLLTRVFGREIAICGQTNKNEYSSTSAKVAQNCFSNLYVFFRVSNPKKVFSRGPVCEIFSQTSSS